MTTYTIFADVSNCYLESGSLSDSYADANAGTGDYLDVIDDVGSLYSGQVYDGDSIYAIYLTYLSFITSVVVGTISSAILSLYLREDRSGTDFTAQARQYNWGASGDTGDWRTSTQLGSTTLLATLASSGIGAAEAYKSFTDVAMIANVNQAGTTYMLVCSSRQGTTPTGEEWLEFYSSDTAGTTKDPKLVVDASAAGKAKPFRRRPPRLWRAYR